MSHVRKGTLSRKIILNQTLTFNHMSFCQLVQKVSDILYLRRLIIALPGYQISYKMAEWRTSEGKCLIKIILWELSLFQKLGHIIMYYDLSQFKNQSNPNLLGFKVWTFGLYI